MDKLKPTLLILKKHHFWVLLGLAVVLGPVIFATTASGLWGEFLKREKSVDQSFNQMDALSRERDHPNDPRIENWKQLHRHQKVSVLGAWTRLYERQREKNPWPSNLPDEFLQVVPGLPADKDIPRTYCQQYHVFIQNFLPELKDIIKCRHPVVEEATEEGKAGEAGPAAAPPAAAPPAGMPGGLETAVKWVGVVDWNPGDWQLLQEGFNFGSQPNSQQVRLAQEDLWVYTALLEIIANTNGPAKDKASAAVKEIMALEIGKRATAGIRANRGTSLIRSAASAGPTPSGMGGELGMGPGGMGGAEPPPMAGPGGMGTGMEPGAGAAGENLLLDRYCKENLEPVPPGEGDPFAEFKMMPFRLSLKIDGKRIPDLLVECAKSRMPAEVKKIRIGMPSTTETMGHGGMGLPGGGMGGHFNPMPQPHAAPPAMGGPGMGGLGMGGPGMGGPGMGGPALTPPDDGETVYDVPIDIEGIIYIYNPPDLAKVGTGTASEEGAGQAATPPETPAPPVGNGNPAPAPGAVPPALPGT
ncbi:MAG: hypothetical protein JW818_11860 [Pirellulales bacterium]|nr:hypothetical protein [Pirellulales bacterium]